MTLSIYITLSVDVCIFEPQYYSFLFLNMIHFYFCRKITFKNKNSHKTVSVVINLSGRMSQKRITRFQYYWGIYDVLPNQIIVCKWISIYFQYKFIKRGLIKTPGNTHKRKKRMQSVKAQLWPIYPRPCALRVFV